MYLISKKGDEQAVIPLICPECAISCSDECYRTCKEMCKGVDRSY